MTKNMFKHGDLVLIDTYDKKVKNADGSYDYFANVWDKEGNEKSLRLDIGREYQIDETNVMPIREIDEDLVLYPLKDVNRTHSAKFYIPGDSLIVINEDGWDEEEDESDDGSVDEDKDEIDDSDTPEDESDEVEPDDESDEDGGDDLDEIKEFASISKSISIVIDSLESVLDSLTKILEIRK